MKPEPAIVNFQAAILVAAAERLGRSLTEVEQLFVTQRKSFLALEAISDTISTLSGTALQRYLRSEASDVV